MIHLNSDFGDILITPYSSLQPETDLKSTLSGE